MQEKYTGRLKIEIPSVKAMECITEYAYTGKLHIYNENAIELLIASDYLLIEGKRIVANFVFIDS